MRILKIHWLRFRIAITTYITLARQFWWHRRNHKLSILSWVIGIIEYILGVLSSLLFILIYPSRSMITFGIFNWMRAMDDLIDGDDPRSSEIDVRWIIKEKSTVLKSIFDLREKNYSANIYDAGLAYAYALSQQLGADQIVQNHATTIWELMIKEKDLCSRPQPRHILDQFAAAQDKAIAELMCFLIGAEPSKFDNLWDNRGVFSKIDWLTDLNDDLAHSLVHISQETLTEAGCTLEDILDQNNKKGLEFRQLCVNIELRSINQAWQKLCDDRVKLTQTFNNPIMKMIFNRVAVDGFGRRLKKLVDLYGPESSSQQHLRY